MIRKRISIAAALVCSLAVISSLSPAHAEPANGEPEPVFVARTGDQTWGEAIRELANSADESADEAAKIQAHWEAASNGEPESVSVVSDDGTIVPTAAATASWSDPNTWIVSGKKSADQWYWIEMIHLFEGAFCASTCSVTDRIMITTTVNPGTITSKLNSRVQYFPNAGNFTTRRWSYVAICSGAICGNGAKIDSKSATVPFTFTGYGNRAGARLTIGLGITQSSKRNTLQLGKKTKDCLGQTGTDRRCKYIY